MSLSNREIIYFDGECGLCHFWVKFVLRFEHRAHFFFSPLQGADLPEDENFAETLVVRTGTGEYLVRSAAIVEILRKMGGIWPVFSFFLAMVPKVLRDAGYNFVASIRKKVFSKPDNLCPIVSPEVRERFK